MRIVVTILFLLFVQLTYGQLYVNEIQSRNESSIFDYRGKNSDWIEIYNGGDEVLSLDGYFISDNSDRPKKWKIPNVEIAKKSFLILYCSNKDTVVNNEYHTNFKLAHRGEKILLSNPEGIVIDQMKYDTIRSGYSQVRYPDGSDNIKKTINVTPGSSNKLNLIVQNHPNSGFYKDPVSVELTEESGKAEIRYTLNGNDPSPSSLLYKEAINLKNASGKPDTYSKIPTTFLEGPYHLKYFKFKEPSKSFFKANVLKYQCFIDDKPVSPIYSKSYLIGEDVFDQFTLPVLSVVTDSLNLYGHKKGVFVPGKIGEKNPWVDYWPSGNYLERGRSWERTVAFSYFNKEGELQFEADSGFRIHGFGSANLPQKSFRLHIEEEYGTSKITHPIYKEDNAPYYKRIVIRNSGNDFIHTHFRDGVIHSLVDDLDLENQNFQACIVFINGEYWGLYNIREYLDKNYFKSRKNIEEEHLIIVRECGLWEHGDSSSFTRLLDFVDQEEIVNDDYFKKVEEKIDIDNFIDYHIIETYVGNWDWPCNNVRFWKSVKPDSKWRVLFFDLDVGFTTHKNQHFGGERGPLDYNLFKESLKAGDDNWPVCDCATKLFRSLFRNEKFKKRFINRALELLDTVFEPKTVIAEIDRFEQIYKPEIDRHIDRWGYPIAPIEWGHNIGRMKHFASERPCIYVSHLMEYFDDPRLHKRCAEQLEKE